MKQRVIEMLTSHDYDMIALGIQMLCGGDTKWFKKNLAFYRYRSNKDGREKRNNIPMLSINNLPSRIILYRDIRIAMTFNQIYCSNINTATQRCDTGYEVVQIENEYMNYATKARFQGV